LELSDTAPPLPNEQRLRLDLCYHGADFSGWQVQPEACTVQGALMSAFAQLCPNQPRVLGAGRTDAGVHALQQVAHVDLSNYTKRTPEQWLNALNSLTPARLCVKSMTEVDSNFHARFSPHTKTYRYQVQWNRYPNPFLIDTAYHLHSKSLDLTVIESFLNAITGTHDFKNYCSSQNATATTLRTLLSAKVISTSNELLHFEFQGKGFLQHMIRILVGTALQLGLNKIALKTAIEALTLDNMRNQLGPTLPAHGLCLVETNYF